MKSKTKVRFRIGAICLIALFLLVSMMSPTVATTSLTAGVVETYGQIGNPIVSVTMDPSTPYTADDDEDHTIVFECDYNFTDDGNSGTTGSNHIATITVWYSDTIP